MADVFEPELDEDTEDAFHYADAGSENVVYLVDASSSMLQTAGIKGVEGYLEEDTYMDLALKVIREILKQHVIGSPKDQMAVIFYNARQAKNSSDFPNIHIFDELEGTTAQRIKEVEMLQEAGNFEEQVGSAGTSSADSLRDGLWAASQAFASASQRATRRLMIFTTEEDPAQAESSDQILQRAKQLQESRIDIQLFNLTPEGQDFSMDFWGGIVSEFDDSLGPQSTEPLRIQDMVLNVRRKSYKKRALTSLNWHWGPTFHVAVKLYALLQKAALSKPLLVHIETNEPLTVLGALICNDTGAVLERVDKFSFPKKGTAPRFPTIILTVEERKMLKAVKPPGIRLIGFKPLACLRTYHQLRNSSFVYPDEAKRPGSATAFIALHDRLLHRDLFALCSFVRSRGAEPRLVALVPQAEEVDPSGYQVAPPGFNQIYLPYADDLRAPETDARFLGPPPYPPATAAQVSAAAAMLRKLTLPDFVPGCVPSPHHQRHYQVIEALALGEEPPDFGPEDDLTLPDNAEMQATAKAEILAFRDSVYGEGNDGAAKPASNKRKAQVDPDKPIDFQEMAKADTLSKLTLPPLKAFCRQNHLSTNGRKDEIIERIMAHIQD